MKGKLTLTLVALASFLVFSCGAPKKAKCDAYSANDVPTNELASR